MNVYDCANDLAKAMRESHEYKKLQEATTALNKDANAKNMVNEFLKLNQDAEFAKIQGKEPDKAIVDKIQELYKVLSLNQDAMQYLNSFMRFQMMLSDVTKNIQDVVTEVVGEK